MIHNPIFIVGILICIEVGVLNVSSQLRFKKYFSFLPPVFWIYFLPMLCSAFGLIDSRAEIYQPIMNLFLPASLVLLLLSSDIKAIIKLGKPALIMMMAGSVGIMIGIPVVFYLLKPWVGSAMWSGFGALSGSWMGGSANMIAVKEAIGTPEQVFAPMVVVDTIVPYVWMGFLVAASGLQTQFDKFNRSNCHILNELSVHAMTIKTDARMQLSLRMTFLIFVLAVICALIARFCGLQLPVIKDVLSPYAWTIIVASLMGLCLSLTPVRNLENRGASKVGYFLLYFVLTTIGAKTNIVNISSTVLLVGAGFLIVLFHAAVVLLTARIIRAPMFLAAVASQANIGGVASAPIVAEVYQPGLASVGLLLAIWGNIVGTYCGIITAQFCRFLAG
ncbi:MAG: DUF819 family protein [Candidatus Omnitrophica bacterium]|nr:DUF819 family protein [Candidatus Omnitrophota bacterium]